MSARGGRSDRCSTGRKPDGTQTRWDANPMGRKLDGTQARWNASSMERKKVAQLPPANQRLQPLEVQSVHN